MMAPSADAAVTSRLGNEEETLLPAGSAAADTRRQGMVRPRCYVGLLLAVVASLALLIAFGGAGHQSQLAVHNSNGVQRKFQTGQCSAEDIRVLEEVRNSTDTTPFFLALRDCSTRAVRLPFLTWDEDLFESCFEVTKLSPSCGACYGMSGEYVFDNCKMTCLMNWCGQSCVHCGHQIAPAVAACVGKTEEWLPKMRTC